MYSLPMALKVKRKIKKSCHLMAATVLTTTISISHYTTMYKNGTAQAMGEVKDLLHKDTFMQGHLIITG